MTAVTPRPRQVAVIGAGEADDELQSLAEEVGRRLAEAGVVVVTGGRGGVMAAASRGARAAGGLAIGVLPGADADSSPPCPDLDAAVFTGLGQARNLAVVLSGDAVVAIGGEWGTLSEIALARKHGRRVVALRSWRVEADDPSIGAQILRARTPEEAVRQALTRPSSN